MTTRLFKNKGGMIGLETDAWSNGQFSVESAFAVQAFIRDYPDNLDHDLPRVMYRIGHAFIAINKGKPQKEMHDLGRSHRVFMRSMRGKWTKLIEVPEAGLTIHERTLSNSVHGEDVPALATGATSR